MGRHTHMLPHTFAYKTVARRQKDMHHTRAAAPSLVNSTCAHAFQRLSCCRVAADEVRMIQTKWAREAQERKRINDEHHRNPSIRFRVDAIDAHRLNAANETGYRQQRRKRHK
jgi:hypothetical protein